MSVLIYKQRHRHPNYKKTPKGNYAHIGYIATRPGAVKNEGMRHGLFGKLEPGAVKEFDTWQEAARLVRELSYRRVNMYRGIISFSPETAAELGLSDHKAWEDYIDRHILTLAKFNGIRVQDLQWVAAHHNEKGHPHIHVVFWNKHQRTMVPFVHPSIPDKIRKQLIRDTFAERIKEYCEAKQREKEHLSAITDEMIDEFEKYMEHLHPQEYRRLREAFGRITDDELGTSPLDTLCSDLPCPDEPENAPVSEDDASDEPPAVQPESASADACNTPDPTLGEQSATLPTADSYFFADGFETKIGRQNCRSIRMWTGGQSIFIPP